MKLFEASLLMLSLTACSSGAPLVTAVDTFCTRVDRFHATDGEREFLKANSGPLERMVRWVAGINKQYDDTCLAPKAGP